MGVAARNLFGFVVGEKHAKVFGHTAMREPSGGRMPGAVETAGKARPSPTLSFRGFTAANTSCRHDLQKTQRKSGSFLRSESQQVRESTNRRPCSARFSLASSGHDRLERRVKRKCDRATLSLFFFRAGMSPWRPLDQNH